MSSFLADKAKLLNENTLLRAQLQRYKDNPPHLNQKRSTSKSEIEIEIQPHNFKDKLNNNEKIDPRLEIFFNKFK